MLVAISANVELTAFIFFVAVGAAIRAAEAFGLMPLPKAAQRWKDSAEAAEAKIEVLEGKVQEAEQDRSKMKGEIAELLSRPNLEEHAAVLREALDGQQVMMQTLLEHTKQSRQEATQSSREHASQTRVLTRMAEQLEVSLNGHAKPVEQSDASA